MSVSKKASKEIRDKFGVGVRGFGSIPVVVIIGKTRWKTSIFPDRKKGTYLLPLKTAVRQNEGISYGKTVDFSVEVRTSSL